MSLSISARPRTQLGRHAGALRRGDVIPAVVYGHRQPALAIETGGRELSRVYQRAGKTTLVELTVEGLRPRKVLFREFQVHPRSGKPLHCDFFAIDLTEKTTADVPVAFHGESPAVNLHLGVVLQVVGTLHVEALPGDLPGQLNADIALLVTAESVITAADVELPAGVTLLTDPEEVIARISGRRVRGGAEDEEEAAEAAAEAAPAGDTDS